jgi:hypothetical protein
MLNLNYNLNSTILDKSTYTLQEDQSFRPFQIQYVIVPGGGGAAAGNNQFSYGTALPKFGIAGNGGVVVTGSYCVQPFITYPITVGIGGKGGLLGTGSYSGSQGTNSAFYNIEAIGGVGGQTQLYTSASGLAGNGSQTIAVVANGGSGSQWTYNLPGCLPYPGTSCHGGELNSSSFYSGGGAGVVVSQSYVPVVFDYLIVGGGGSGQSKTAIGGNTFVGGGGGGAVLSSSFDYTLFPTLNSYKSASNYVFDIVVGSGGLGVINSDGNAGSLSSAFGYSAQGGKGAAGVSGGNSGTGSANSNFTTGFTGGALNGGGGAGARQDGVSGIDLGGGNWTGGAGGNGAPWSGSYYGGGSGGAVNVGGGTTYSGTSGLGVSNAGGGGGSSLVGTLSNNGISGSVIIKYFGVKKPFIDGGSVSYDGTYTTHTFASSSQLIISPSIPTLEVEFLVVGAGGGGMNNQDTCNNGTAFGGGGGAAISASFLLQPIVKTYPIIVGAGGIGKYACLVDSASNGQNSSAFGVIGGGGQGANSGNSGGNSGTGSVGLTTPFLAAGSRGGAGSAQNSVAPNNGGSGLQWVDGNYYAGGGYGGTQQGGGSSGTYGQTTLQYGYYPGRGGAGTPGNGYNLESNGNSGSVAIRYYGTGSKATGGQVFYSASYTYHYFTQSGNFTLLESSASMFTSGIPGEGDGYSYFSTSGSTTPIAYTGGAGAAANYNQNGVSGSNGFVAIRYEGLPLADGGTVVITDHYTYHLFSSSADFYVIGQETNPNINPCG